MLLVEESSRPQFGVSVLPPAQALNLHIHIYGCFRCCLAPVAPAQVSPYPRNASTEIDTSVGTVLKYFYWIKKNYIRRCCAQNWAL